MAWTSADLIASVKRRTGMPVAQGTFTTSEILAIANEEMASYVVPLVCEEHEDYWLTHSEQPIVQGVYTYPIPSRAVGGNLAEVLLLDAHRNPTNPPRLAASDLVDPRFGFSIESDGVALYFDSLSRIDHWETLRLSFYARPAQLVETSAVTTIVSLDDEADTITLASVPTGYGTATSFDLISDEPPFATRGYDIGGSITGSVLIVPGGLPQNVTAGDYVCLPDTSPVPQMPVELFGLLAQKVACKVLEGKGWADKLPGAEKELSRLEKNARALLAPRVSGEALRVVNRRSLFRMRF